MRAVCAFALLWGVASQLQLDTSGVFLAPGASAIAYDTNTVDVQVCAQVFLQLTQKLSSIATHYWAHYNPTVGIRGSCRWTGARSSKAYSRSFRLR